MLGLFKRLVVIGKGLGLVVIVCFLVWLGLGLVGLSWVKLGLDFNLFKYIY